MRPKAQTLIERAGFMDPDRLNSRHDEIQLWAYDNLEQLLGQLTTEGNRIQILSRKLEYPITQASSTFSSIVGFVDLFASGRVHCASGDFKSFSAAIEIKSTIPCVGDLIRQINFYRKFQTTNSIWIVISPVDKFERVLRDQLIYFIKYKAPGQLF